ncbi:DUF4430 domain-containing protein [Roseiconus lacunae]|uniref:DUF4430 domain-containing protein n=1 Tax=Roseiconus lacunae TaxID=2605694 RepID=UPI0011F0BBCC|nr:DUF4430 domain-containing protein [Roseiconus lacunae]MCD0459501.1 DUF4430 domain-containing protein [Roseiconus lacunae]
MMKNGLYLIGLYLTVTWVSGCGAPQTDPDTGSTVNPGVAEANATGPVTIVIDRGTGEETTETISDVADGETLESVMKRVESAEIKFRGSGTTAFVESIGDLGTTSGEGWTFTIDDEFASQGIGQLKLHPPTKIRWSYGGFE